MRWWLAGRFVIPGVVALMALPVGILAQCPRQGYVHFVLKPDHPVQHNTVDDVIIEGAPGLEELIRTKVGTWLERNPSEESGETDVTIQVEPGEAAARRAREEEELRLNAPEGDSPWIDALGELVRDVLRDNGYFRAQVTVEKIVLSSDANQDHVSLTFHISEGKQYRLGDIQFSGSRVFPPWQLRNQVPLPDGAILDLGKIRKGVENLTKMYGALGYINFSASPNVEIDEAQERISVTFDLEEERQFTVGRVEVLGLATDAPENEPKIRLKTGDPFNPELVDAFYSDNKSILPPNASNENTQINQNSVDNTVDVVFDFRSCP